MLSDLKGHFVLTTTALDAFGTIRIFDYNKYRRHQEPMRHLMIRVPAVWIGLMIASIMPLLFLIPEMRAAPPLDGGWFQTVIVVLFMMLLLYVASVLAVQLVLWAFWSPIVIGAAFFVDTLAFCVRRVNRASQQGISALAAVNSHKIECVTRLAAFLLPRQIRIDSFETTFEELREDFAKHRRRYRSRHARAFLSACFIFKIVGLYLDCLRVWGLDKFVWLIPPAIRMLWRKP